MKKKTFLPMLFCMAVLVAHAQKKPNILICLADDATAAFTGTYGASWVKTPNMDRVATEGLLFMRAYTPNAKCSPSRSCILTGRNSWQLEEAANHFPFFPEKFKTYPEALGENGYFTGYTGKGWSPGDPGKKDGKPRTLLGPNFSERTMKTPTREIANNDYAGNFKAFLDAKPADQPFCFWFGCNEPHRAYEFGTGVSVGGKKLNSVTNIPAFWPEVDSVRHDMLDYAFELEWFDMHLGKILAELERRGELSNTLLIVTADNGMPFPRMKGQAYEYSNHLPLMVMWPSGIQSPGRRIDDFVSFIDFTPTIFEAAGLDPIACGMQPVTGKSLLPIFKSPSRGQIEPWRDHVLIGKERHDIGRPNDVGYPIRGIVKGDYLYVQNFETDRWPSGNPETGYLNCDGGATKSYILHQRRYSAEKTFWELCFGMRPKEELYNIRQDPSCTRNLATLKPYRKQKKQLCKQLFAQLKNQGDPRMFGKGEIFDQYPYSDAKNRGFYERFMSGEKPGTSWIFADDVEPTPIGTEKKKK